MSTPPPRTSLSWKAWLGWVSALALMLLLLGHPPVERTQEARVLETAREMLGHPPRDWLIPHLNGQLRLEKPPLAYWLAAISFRIGGVNEGAGRVPFALFGWGTLIVTWLIARQLFEDRAAFYAAAALLSGMMFARHARLAETDILAVFFVTAAIGCILRASGPGAVGANLVFALPTNGQGRTQGWPLQKKWWLWFALSGLMIGMAILAKGLPAVFAIVCLLGLSAATRDWRLLLRWAISGAPILALAIGAPWFLYVRSAVGLKTIADEAEIGVQGMEHKGSAIQYIPQLLEAAAPWTALMVLALVLAFARWCDDRRLRAVLVWAGAVIVPLCFAGQKQSHYLFPAMPALAVLTGWLINRVIERDLPQWELGRALLVGTNVVLLAGALALPIVGRAFRGSILPIDWICLGLCAVCAAIPLALYRRELRQSALSFAITVAVAMSVLTQAWMPSLANGNARIVAAGVRGVGPGPCYFYGNNVSLPLVFYLQQEVPRLVSFQKLKDAMRQHPDLIVIAQTKSGVSPPPIPGRLERALEIRKQDQTFVVYRVRPPAK